MRVAVPPMPGRIAPMAMSVFAHIRCRVSTLRLYRSADNTAPPIRKITA
jgi:hypothetical protein